MKGDKSKLPACIDPVLRVHEVSLATSMPPSTVERETRLGRFPKSIRLTERTVGWRSSEVQAWIAQREIANP